MNIKFIKYDGIKGYSRVMYNDVKDADKYEIEVAYNGKDIKALLEYLFEQENKIDKAIEYINKRMVHEGEYYFRKAKHFRNTEFGKDLLQILGEEKIEEIPLFEGTLEQLNNLSIIGDKENE